MYHLLAGAAGEAGKAAPAVLRLAEHGVPGGRGCCAAAQGA